MCNEITSEISFLCPDLSKLDAFKFRNLIAHISRTTESRFSSCKILSVKCQDRIYKVGDSFDKSKKSAKVSLILRSEEHVFIYSFEKNYIQTLPVCMLEEIVYYKTSKCFCSKLDIQELQVKDIKSPSVQLKTVGLELS